MDFCTTDLIHDYYDDDALGACDVRSETNARMSERQGESERERMNERTNDSIHEHEHEHEPVMDRIG